MVIELNNQVFGPIVDGVSYFIRIHYDLAQVLLPSSLNDLAPALACITSAFWFAILGALLISSSFRLLDDKFEITKLFTTSMQNIATAAGFKHKRSKLTEGPGSFEKGQQTIIPKGTTGTGKKLKWLLFQKNKYMMLRFRLANQDDNTPWERIEVLMPVTKEKLEKQIIQRIVQNDHHSKGGVAGPAAAAAAAAVRIRLIAHLPDRAAVRGRPECAYLRPNDALEVYLEEGKKER